jgi:hypothetical protein
MSRKLTVKLPSLVGTQEYDPTGLQIQVLCAFLETVNRGQQADPISLLAAMGKAKTNWYNWAKKEGFMSWWNRAIDEYFSGHGIREVHASVYRNALGNSAADRKLYLERFDEGYKPVSRTEIEAYAGRRPPDAAEARERNRKRVEAITNNKE